MLTNPVLISVIVMLALSLVKLPVLLSLLFAALVGGLMSGMGFGGTMAVLVGGMAGNANTALSYVLLGSLAAAMEMTGAARVLSIKIGNITRGNKYVLVALVLLVSMASGTVIPVHIAFIPILIPPLLSAMNKMKMDRRMLSVTFGLGLKVTYLTIPIAYGAIFHGLIKDSMAVAGVDIDLSMIWKVNWIAGLAMIIGFVIAIFIYRKPREYEMREPGEIGGPVTNINDSDIRGDGMDEGFDAIAYEDVEIKPAHVFAVLAGIAALVVQLLTDSLPLGALAGLTIMIVSRSIRWNQVEEMLNGGIKMMGLIAFVMLVAAGYATVINETGGVPGLVDSAVALLGSSKLVGATVMVVLGLLVTLGIGTSFGTVPVIAAIYVPLGLQLGFSIPSIILLISVAAVAGDAGSPASDTTLGPTSGLNADGQHDHIWDTCVPQFIAYNIPLMIAGVLGAMIIG